MSGTDQDFSIPPPAGDSNYNGGGLIDVGNYESVLSKECSRCLFDHSIAKIHEDGICEYCKLQERLAAQADPGKWPDVLVDIKRAGKGKQYDCLIGISGGMDSSVMLYLAVFAWRLRPLVIHMDNRWNTKQADHNVKFMADLCNVNLITHRLDKREYDDLNDAFLLAGVPDADIPNDIAMTKLMYETASKHGIKYILNGHDFRNEGSSPAAWTYMDAKYVNSVYKTYHGKDLVNYPLFTFWDQIFYGLIGIKQVRPFHYEDHNYSDILEILKHAGWKDYGAKHAENIYTEFVGAWLLPNKFGIDKRRVYFSAKIREGKMTKQDAKELLRQPLEFDVSKLGERADGILYIAQSKINDRKVFDRYNFKKYWLVIWILARLKVVPWTMYFKYCKR